MTVFALPVSVTDASLPAVLGLQSRKIINKIGGRVSDDLCGHIMVRIVVRDCLSSSHSHFRASLVDWGVESVRKAYVDAKPFEHQPVRGNTKEPDGVAGQVGRVATATASVANST